MGCLSHLLKPHMINISFLFLSAAKEIWNKVQRTCSQTHDILRLYYLQRAQITIVLGCNSLKDYHKYAKGEAGGLRLLSRSNASRIFKAKGIGPTEESTVTLE